MRFLLRAFPLFCGLALLPSFGQTGPAGHWDGTLQLPDRELQLTLDLAKDDLGAWTGTFGQPAQNLRNIPVSALKVDDKTVRFALAGGGGNAPGFDCKLESAAAMTCSVSGPGGSVNASFRRTGEAKVDLPKASAAVSADLEGAWEGAIETPNGTLHLIIHFRNQPDKTVQATLDSLDQNAHDLPLTDVAESGNSIVFQLRMASGAYKGTLDKEKKQIAGEWTQGGNTMPLTLKKTAAK
jgi:hypothetical protein